ncbi:MAG: hypothetical protein HRT51_09320 [Colwellia sp.]|nr:hypothetical protein [Colwellia sp.]
MTIFNQKPQLKKKTTIHTARPNKPTDCINNKMALIRDSAESLMKNTLIATAVILASLPALADTVKSDYFERGLSVEDENRLRNFRKQHNDVNVKTNEAIMMTDDVAALIEAIAAAPTDAERNELLNQATGMLITADTQLETLKGKNLNLASDHENFIQSAKLADENKESLSAINDGFFTMGAKLEQLAAKDGLKISDQLASDINALYEMKYMAADLLESDDFSHYGNKLTVTGAMQLSYQVAWEGQFIKTAQIIVKRLAGILKDANDRGTLTTTITASLRGFNFSQPSKRKAFLSAVKTLEKGKNATTQGAENNQSSRGMIWNRQD